jgi:hypothetical protein
VGSLKGWPQRAAPTELINGNIEKTSVVEEKNPSFSGSPKSEIDLKWNRPPYGL